MSNRRIVFHFPERLDQKQDGASRLRPNKMIQAFRAAGYEVDVVAGFASERREAIRRVRAAVRSGVNYDFLYSEASTMPTMLTEPHHLPTHPFLDLGFLIWFRRHVAPVGLFYRDVYWQFPEYVEQIGFLKSFIGRIFYWLDFILYYFAVSHLFLPTIKMRKVFPWWLQKHSMSALPAGCDEVRAISRIQDSPKLRLLYVGGITPPYYDLRPMFKVARELDQSVELTVCCRQSEWSMQMPLYKEYLGPNIQVVHQSSAEIPALFANADVFTMYRAKHPYWSFGAPYKVFEALSYGLPIVCRSDEGLADEIAGQGWGWVFAEDGQLRTFLSDLAGDEMKLQKVRADLAGSWRQQSWRQRIDQVRTRVMESP